MDYDLIIIGGGPAGLTAGIYASRARLKTLLLEKNITGGLAATTDKLENYPGFPDGIGGMELLEKIKKQAERFGTEIKEFEEVRDVKPLNKRIEITTVQGEYSALSVIIASGSEPKKLNVPGEEKFRGRGVSYCATCDGPLFGERDVAVVGCGDSGLQEGEYLLKFVKSITFVEFLPHMTAEKILQERFQNRKNTRFLLNHRLISISGSQTVSSILVRDREKGKEEELPVSGLFVYVGLKPNSDFLKDVVELDTSGFVVTNEKMETSIPGIFAAGDIRSKDVRQVSTAVGDGTLAAIAAEKYIQDS
ncbi:thioredoxin-disulfide reductase [candidate division WOR-3 bacterium JGI_Cruoil_03_44_89]|uniref:Thioredoxin reductase n=1 Tax=candidate division WOR-3 bacterium JGI_Cruoil_03_44_89 TaxID=1973748 RepID=A0A235BUH7_UNCW3|nr:MAG: thioredoxin-disulfide reductase [candidate division WOR-3 bacterium JGI_Cruoil_03_44_89]